jgi:hypothetical protein
MFAPAMPPMIRAKKMIASELASASTRYDRQEPASPIRMIGRRPTRSDSRPQTGEKRNCISEKLVPSSPTMNALAPYDSA